MYKYRPDYLTAKLRRSRCRIARSMGLSVAMSNKIKDWSKRKFIEYLNCHCLKCDKNA